MSRSAGTQSAFDRGGVLDENGCVPGGKLPIREHWQLGTDLKVFLRLISQHCLDPSGTECAAAGTPPILAGANVVITQGDQVGPAALCAVFAENPASITDPTCVVRPITWTDVPPSPLRPAFVDNNSITRTGAVFSQMFKREHVTGGSLGIVRAMVERRLEGTSTPGRVGVKVDKYRRQPARRSARRQPELHDFRHEDDGHRHPPRPHALERRRIAAAQRA